MSFHGGPRLACLAAGCVALSLSIAGCGNAGPGESTGENGAPVTAVPEVFTNDKAAFDYFLGKGLQNFQAAGIVGNLDQESGVDPTAVQYGGGPGRGIAQWSTGGRWDTDANDNATWYASTQGQQLLSLQLQLDFIWYELTTFSTYGLSALQSSTDVTSATNVFMSQFEICGTCDATQRVTYAQQVLAAYGNDVVDAGSSSGSGSGSGSTSSSSSSSSGSSSGSSGGSGSGSSSGSTGGSSSGSSSGSTGGSGSGSGGVAAGSSGSSSGVIAVGPDAGSAAHVVAGLGGSGGSAGCDVSATGRGGGSERLAALGLVGLVLALRRRRVS